VLDAVPEGEIKQQVAKELSPGRAIIQDAVVDGAVFALVFLAVSWVLSLIA
jgi:hypothetical protein